MVNIKSIRQIKQHIHYLNSIHLFVNQNDRNSLNHTLEKQLEKSKAETFYKYTLKL